MTRPLCAVTIIVILAIGTSHTRAQSPSAVPSSQAALKEAKQLNQQVEKLYGEGKFQDAVAPAERALALREKVFGPTHPDVAESLNNLALLYQAQGAYTKAEPLLTRALDIHEKVLGPSHPDVASSLNNLAVLYQTQGAYTKAQPLYARALDIDERALGSTHPGVAIDLNNLASLYRTQGAYAKAEPLLVRALGIDEKALGPTHPSVASDLNTLAALYEDQGAYAKAEPLYIRALDIREKALGPTHPDVATSLNNLAELYWDQGAYGKAEPLYIRALDITEKTLGATHPAVATSLNNLAELYWDQGAYGKAEPLFTRALGIREKTLGPTHRDVAVSLNNLAALYETQGAYGKAEPLLVRALDLFEKALGPTHPDVANSLNNLAMLYEKQGVYGKAEPLHIRALDIREKALGPSHPLVATSLANLALLYETQGAYGKAEPLYTRALDIREKALGPSHPLVATSLNNLAGLYRDQGAYGKAEPLLARAADIQEQQLRDELGRLSETRKREMMALLQGETDGLVSFHADTIPTSVTALELALTTILRRKGRILDSLVDSQTRLRAHLTPRLQGLFDQLSQARSDLVARLYAPAGPPSAPATNRNAIAAIRVHIDEQEAALSAASEDFRTHVAPVTVATVQAALPADTALVEFVRYHRFDPRQAQKPWQEARYVAYLLTPQGPPRWVALGEAAPIDAAIDGVLRQMGSQISAADAKAALRRLDAQVWAPIRAQLSGISHVILAPDGKLNLVPFEALIDSQGHYALESYLVSYVTSGRDLMRLASPQRPRASAVIVAGPDYGPVPSSATGSVLSFSALEGAAGEAMDLRGYFPTAPVTGANATKAALAKLTGPALLHIATHGFYGWRAGVAGGRSAGVVAPRGRSRSGVVDVGSQPPPPTRDPAEGLDQSGLAMAGANRGPDGIVTAREIAGFDWWGTQLVVLSACETGVGAVPSGDGVYGLRRALVLAGAASQVVSLWSVSDASTRALMRDYYGELKKGTGRAEALRRVQLRMLHQPGTAHPFYWAAFIPAGDWRPLDKSVFSPQRPTP